MLCMKYGYFKSALIASSILFSAPALASHSIILPNGIEVPYFGQSTPIFTSVRAPSQNYYQARDVAGAVVYYYSEAGTWAGATGSGASSLTLPTVPTSVTLPNGSVVPYTGQGVPDLSFTDSQGNFHVIDPVSQRDTVYSSQGQPIGGGSWSDEGSNPILNSSSSFGTHPGGGTNPGGETSGGVTGPSSSGSTSVPAPPAFALFGFGAAGLIARRFRSRKNGSAKV
jgi:hypothetical protein